LGDATRTGIRSQRTDPSAVMARAEQRSEQFSEQNAAREKAGTAADEDAEARKKTADERKANCDQAQERSQNYRTARRLYRPQADGSREYLTDQELSEARAAADDAVNTWCK
jgi:catalase